MLLFIACSSDTPLPGEEEEETETSPYTFADITITPTAIPTVLDVSFTTDAPEAGWVAFGPDGEDGWTATATSTGEGAWSARLVGLPAETLSWVTVGAGDATGPTTAHTTEEAPDWVDLLDTSEGTPTPGFLAFGVEGGGSSGAVITDTRGRPVWWFETPEETIGTIHSRARLSSDLSEVWFNAFTLAPPGGYGDGLETILRVAIDGSSYESIATPNHHHDFALHEDGTLAWIGVDEREVDGDPIRGDVIVERAPDGTETTVWNAWDTITYDPNITNDGADAYWTFSNHLEWDPDEGAYTLSLRNLNTIMRVSRDTGEILWSAGSAGDYVPDDPWTFQHGFDVLDGELLIFDNGPAGMADSRAARYTLDGGSATHTWEYRADPAIYSLVMGDVHALADDAVRVVFTTQADVREVSADGEVVASFTWELGDVWLGFAESHDALVE